MCYKEPAGAPATFEGGTREIAGPSISGQALSSRRRAWAETHAYLCRYRPVLDQPSSSVQVLIAPAKATTLNGCSHFATQGFVRRLMPVTKGYSKARKWQDDGQSGLPRRGRASTGVLCVYLKPVASTALHFGLSLLSIAGPHNHIDLHNTTSGSLSTTI